MAEIIGKTGKQSAARIDMTPMVDLAFLLLTFFVLAATLAKPRAQEIIYPEDGSEHPTPLNGENAFTILLGPDEEHIAYYHGLWNDSDTLLHYSALSREGLRKALLSRNREQLTKMTEWKRELESGKISAGEFLQLREQWIKHQAHLTVIVKTMSKTPFRFVISAMDEIEIADIQRRVVQSMEETERKSLLGHKQMDDGFTSFHDSAHR